MDYYLKCSFKGKPECKKCILSWSRGLGLDGESVIACHGLTNRPKCPDAGCHKDCPLKEAK